MKQIIKHIIFRVLVVLAGMLAIYKVEAQLKIPVQKLTLPQCDSYEFSVENWPGDRYTWDLYQDTTANFAFAKGDVDPAAYFEDGMYEGSTVTVNWLDPGRYILRVMVWDETTCTNNLMIFYVLITEHVPELVLIGDSVCEDETALLKVVFTGLGPWEAVYTYGDGTDHLNLNGPDELPFVIEIPGLPVGTREYWVMEVTDQCTVHSYPEPYPDRARITIFRRPFSQRINVKNK